MNKGSISMAVIRRLPKYHRCLSDMIDKGIERISSKELSETIGFSASQIRQDFNNFGKFGQQGYGYNVEDLHSAISNIIGLQHTYRLIVLGAGNLGEALVNFGFEKLGFQVDALFDNNTEKIGKIVHGVEVLDVNILETYMSKHPVDIAVITTPVKVAQQIADRVVISGARSIWNFAPVDLVVPEDVIVENVHLVDNLMTLAYLLNS
ncbi:MAG TPA: redox-sensing transcriptional repressor Rex [Tissierellia bacterium]|jgi:redox-sensing transcriptional repressor|nr:redox-sensing transcriptional repressor Rex [Tissierellia bacterium]